MPPMGGAAGFSSGASTMQHSDVVSSEATPEASWSAVRTTLKGSRIPAAMRSLYSPEPAS